MELTVRDAANEVGVSTHVVNDALRMGSLHALRTIGNTVLLDDLAVQAWNRSRARGRRWDPATRDAALDLLSTGSTKRLQGSRLSRLRSALRSSDARRIAYLAGGLGGVWARYQSFDDALAIDQLHETRMDLGITPGSQAFARADDLRKFEREHLVDLDADGNLGVIERAPDNRSARILLDIYLLGSARESAVARERLEEAGRAV